MLEENYIKLQFKLKDLQFINEENITLFHLKNRRNYSNLNGTNHEPFIPPFHQLEKLDRHNRGEGKIRNKRLSVGKLMNKSFGGIKK